MALLDEIKKDIEKLNAEVSEILPKFKSVLSKVEKGDGTLTFESLMAQIDTFVNLSLRIDILYNQYNAVKKDNTIDEKKIEQAFNSLIPTFLSAMQTLTQTYLLFAPSLELGEQDNAKQTELNQKADYITAMNAFHSRFQHIDFNPTDKVEISPDLTIDKTLVEEIDSSILCYLSAEALVTYTDSLIAVQYGSDTLNEVSNTLKVLTTEYIALESYNPNVLPDERLSDEEKIAHYTKYSEDLIVKHITKIAFLHHTYINTLNKQNNQISIKNYRVNRLIEEKFEQYYISLFMKVNEFLNNMEMAPFVDSNNELNRNILFLNRFLKKDVTQQLIKNNKIEIKSATIQTEEAARRPKMQEKIEEKREKTSILPKEAEKYKPYVKPNQGDEIKYDKVTEVKVPSSEMGEPPILTEQKKPVHMNKKVAELMAALCGLGGSMFGAGFIGLMGTLSHTAIMAAGTGALAGGVLGGPVGILIGTVIGLVAGLALGAAAGGVCYYFFPKPKEPNNNKNNKSFDYPTQNLPREENDFSLGAQK